MCLNPIKGESWCVKISSESGGKRGTEQAAV